MIEKSLWWQLQWITPLRTAATVHCRWVQILLNALKSPLVGWVTTNCAGSSKITPPPTGTLETATLGHLGGLAALVGLDADFFAAGDEVSGDLATGDSADGDPADGDAGTDLPEPELAGTDEPGGAAVSPSAEQAATMPPPPVRAARPTTRSTARRLVPA